MSKCAHGWDSNYCGCKTRERKDCYGRGDAIVYFSDCHRNSISRTPQLLGAYETKDFVLFLALKEYDFLFIPLVPLSTFHLAREDYCFYLMTFWGKSLSCLLHPAHTHTRKWESCCLKYHNHIAQGEINCGFFWSPENFFLFLTKSLLLSSPSPSPSTNTDST